MQVVLLIDTDRLTLCCAVEREGLFQKSRWNNVQLVKYVFYFEYLGGTEKKLYVSEWLLCNLSREKIW